MTRTVCAIHLCVAWKSVGDTEEEDEGDLNRRPDRSDRKAAGNDIVLINQLFIIKITTGNRKFYGAVNCQTDDADQQEREALPEPSTNTTFFTKLADLEVTSNLTKNEVLEEHLYTGSSLLA